MTKKLRKPLSIILSLMMILSVFTIIPVTSASAAVGDYLSEDNYLTFTAEEAGSTVTLNVASGSNFQYDLNGTGLTDYSPGTEITLANAGDYVRFSGTGTKFSSSKHFSTTGKVACSGNVMSMRLNGGEVQGLENLCFRYMFYNCTGLTTAPDLLETDLKAGCYSYMFNGCTSLTTAPDLPATTLAESCYNSMFMGCTSLTTAPDLPATVLAINCYLSMFKGCTSLTEAPELPATTLANYCYQNMFKGCTSLTEAPELPATTLASYCYSNMFRDCKSLTEAPELPATNLAQYCYASMFYGCTSLTKAPELPATNLAVSCYNYMFYGCTSLTELPALPATTLQSSCYYGMFSGCKNIRISDEAGTFDEITYSAEYRIPTTGEGTSATNALTSMFTSTGGKFKGTPDINTTYYVPAPASAPELPDVIKDCTYQVFADTYANKPIDEGNFSEINNGAIYFYIVSSDSFLTVDAMGYSYKFYDQTGTEIPAEATDANLFSGNELGISEDVIAYYTDFKLTLPDNFEKLYIVATVPEVADELEDCTYSRINMDSHFLLYGNVPLTSMESFEELPNGAVAVSYQNEVIHLADTKGYTYAFYDAAGTEIPVTLNTSESFPGSEYNLTDDVTINSYLYTWEIPLTCKAVYVVATAPAPETFKAYVKKLNGETYTIENLTGETTVAQLKEIIADQIDIPVTAQQMLVFAGKKIDDAKTLAEYNIGNESIIQLVIRGYTVTWLNYDNSELSTTTVQYGLTPSYDGDTPEKADDDQYTYTFAGWRNGENTYGLTDALPAVSGDVAYTAVFDATEKAPAHIHNFTYSADGATITASCGEGCDITEGLTLTISAPEGTLTADGTTTFPATLNDDYNTTAFPGTYTIVYTKDGQPYDGTPTEAGDYTASVTVGTATASVEYTIAQSAALTEAKTNAAATVNGVNANDYIAADQETVANAKTTALAAINAATTEDEVTAAMTTFNNAIAACTTQAAQDLADAKTTATNTVNGVNANDYIAADQETVTNAKTAALNAISAATTVDAVNTAMTTFNNAIADCTTQAAADLAAAKTTATATVNGVNANDYIAADQQTVTNAKTAALNAISAATTVDAVNTAMTTFNNAIADCTTQAAADLAAAKTNAENEVNAVNAADYITADQETVTNAKTIALAAIEAAATVADVETALTNFNNAIADCTTQAAADLAAAKTNAENEVNAVNAADYINADQQTVADAKTTALAAIEAATTAAEVETALADFNNAIADCTTQAAADKAAADAVSDAINALPAATDVTVDNKDDIEAARDAYEALTDAQKALLAPETLAKLEAAEKALIPELVNESYIENDVSEMKIGNSITVICDSTGGAGTKQYEVWYKSSTATKWTKAQSLSDNTSVSITPKHTGEYTVSVKVKDEAGTAVKKRMSFTVTTDLENTSEISASAILKGDSITVTCASTGGVGTKQYEVWYKRSTATKWTKAQSLSDNTSVSITPKHIGEYTISVKVKDEAGIAIKKYIPLTVTTDLENTSEISASAISKGDSITATCASTGGVGTKEYEVWYKHSTATKWTRVQRFSTNTSVVITPKHTGEYTVSVKVKDEVGTAIKKRMPLTVS